MSFYVWTEIVCVGCSATGAGYWTDGSAPRRLLAADVKKDRWKLSGKNWRCPRCEASSCIIPVSREG